MGGWIAAGGIVVGAGLSLATTSACTTHDCDPSYSTFGALDAGVGVSPDAGTGIITSESGFVTWQSSAPGGPWLDYPGNRTITVTYPAVVAAANPCEWYVVPSTGPYQDEAGATATTASGQLDYITNITPTGFQLQNNTCSQYNVYFVVHTCPSGAPADAGSDATHE